MKMKSAGVVDGGLFTESYCNICNAQLISESQRTAHYESKKHANKVRLFYMLHPEDGGPPSKRLRPDNPSFCLFTSLTLSSPCDLFFPHNTSLHPSNTLFYHRSLFFSCRTVQRQKWTETSAVPCVTCSSPPPLWPSPTIRAKPMPRESVWCWGSHPPYPQPWPALQTQIPLLPLRCPQTPLPAPLLPRPYPGPWRWSVETEGERQESIAACVEPGSTTP
uniref:Zgc:171482 n=1 Tax=Acanthochromis polyacanthus TaxID=80966 RepID=A0A3Q1FMC7_9TELE